MPNDSVQKKPTAVEGKEELCRELLHVVANRKLSDAAKKAACKEILLAWAPVEKKKCRRWTTRAVDRFIEKNRAWTGKGKLDISELESEHVVPLKVILDYLLAHANELKMFDVGKVVKKLDTVLIIVVVTTEEAKKLNRYKQSMPKEVQRRDLFRINSRSVWARYKKCRCLSAVQHNVSIMKKLERAQKKHSVTAK